MNFFKVTPVDMVVYISNFLDDREILTFTELFKKDLEYFLKLFQVAKQMNGINAYFLCKFDFMIKRGVSYIGYTVNTLPIAVEASDSLFIRAYFYNIKSTNYLMDYEYIKCNTTICKSKQDCIQLSIDCGIVIIIKNSIIFFVKRDGHLVDKFLDCDNYGQKINIYNQLVKKAEI